MRLIDAHKVQLKLFEECQNIRYFDKDRKKPQIFADALDFAWVMLDNQPTVEAIPKEWIKKYIHKLEKEDNGSQYEYVSFSTVGQIYDMLNEWEKENETN